MRPQNEATNDILSSASSLVVVTCAVLIEIQEPRSPA